MTICIVFMILISLCSVMNADFTASNNAYSLISHYNVQTPPLPSQSQCTGILDEFAEAASNFTRCSIKHARPVRLCAKCVEQYILFYDKYEELIANETCKNLFISHDRLDAVLEYHDNIMSVWDKGNCYDCFDWDKGKPTISDNTKLFNAMFNETMDCIVNSINPDANNTEEVCKNCMSYYIKLDEFYKNLSVDSIGVDTVCMDIVDSMNATRYIWSKVLDCCNLRKTPEIIFLCCTAIIATLPILFYVAVRFWGPIRTLPNVLKQSRFKQLILRSSESERIN